MHTIQLGIQEEQYNYIQKSGIDIQSKFNEFLTGLIIDKYPPITTCEAKERVKKAVEDYKANGDNYQEIDSNYWNKLRNKISNHKAN
ncbi:MAG: hypothetical protein OIF32_03060 [Campylobacterales bacterium]|nr:hypothetical protein [Campylobacterales bacterium]